MSKSIALSVRGICTFKEKADAAQSGGAGSLLVINNNEGKVNMVSYLVCNIV